MAESRYYDKWDDLADLYHDYLAYGKESLEKRRMDTWRYWRGTMNHKMAMVEVPGIMQYSWNETYLIIGIDKFIAFGELVDVVYGWRIKSPLDKIYYSVWMKDIVILFKKEDIYKIIQQKEELKSSFK